MSYAKALKCRACGKEYPLEPIYVCEYCFGPVEVIYDYERLAKNISHEIIAKGPLSSWRYIDFLPVDGEPVDINPGFTPLIRARNLGEVLGLDNLYLKNDCVNPTYSYKDRVVSVAATKAREFGFKALACASTGNLAGSVAAHAARAGMQAYVFIPADLEKEKILGAAVYGPKVVAVNGNYDDVNRLCSELVEIYPWAFVNINIRPYYAEGCKTMAYEIAEQLGWHAPDHVIVPVASGSLHNKIWKGFKELKTVGLIGALKTHMHVTQGEGSSPIVTAFHSGSPHINPVKPKTIAKSLAIGNPADGIFAVRASKESSGSAVASSDSEIIEGMKLLAQTEGIFGETAGGVVIAGLKKLVKQGLIPRNEEVVALITGCGLKTLEAIASAVPDPITIQPTMVSFNEKIGKYLNNK